MDYDRQLDIVNARYQILKSSEDALEVIKRELGLSFTEAIEFLGISDELEFLDEKQLEI